MCHCICIKLQVDLCFVYVIVYFVNQITYIVSVSIYSFSLFDINCKKIFGFWTEPETGCHLGLKEIVMDVL